MINRVSTQRLIDLMKFKAENIKAHIEPVVFNEVADRLEELEEYKKMYEDLCE